jgi:hypothetical protein
MGKESAARKYFVKANPLRPGQPEKRPYLDIFTKDSDNPVFHGKDITVNHVWLAFKCEQFARERPEERADFALLLSEETISRQSADVKKQYAELKLARAARLREGNVRAGEVPSPNYSVSTGLASSVWLHGLRAVTPSSVLSTFVQRVLPADVEVFRKLQLRFQVTNNLPLKLFDKNPAWDDLLKYIAPAFAQYSINRAYITNHKARRFLRSRQTEALT